MLRTKLLLAILALLSIVFIMAALLYRGPAEMARHLDRSLFAHEQTEGYLRLAGDTYRHIWHLADRLIAVDELPGEEPLSSRAQVRERLRELEQMTIAELAIVGDREPKERQELLRIKQLADAIAAGIIAFNKVQELSPEAPERAQRLALLRQKIGRDFADLIDEAIADEREETREADDQVRRLLSRLRWLAATLAIVAAVTAAGLGYWLFQNIKRPIQDLLLGTQRIAAGELDHRIDISGRDEFGDLAGSFNSMAGDLARQRASLIQAQEGLEEKVRERTRELELANLTLKRLDDVRRQMFADISHELRTPLTIISGDAEVTLRATDAQIDDYRKTLTRIIDLSGQVARQVEDILFLARSDTADLRMSKRSVLIQDILEDAAEDLRALASGKDIEVELQLAKDAHARIEVDPNRIAQLLLILVDNACRYSEAKSSITVSVVRQPDRMLINVADQGIGIPPEDVNVVFDRYFRGARARDLAPKGIGLGLHVAKTIAEAHGGRLMIDSRQNVGTTITLVLPILEPDKGNHADLVG